MAFLQNFGQWVRFGLLTIMAKISIFCSWNIICTINNLAADTFLLCAKPVSLHSTKSCFVSKQIIWIPFMIKRGKKNFLTKSHAVTNIRKAFLLANLVLSVVFPVTLMVFVYALGALVKKMANGLMESSQILLLCDWSPSGIDLIVSTMKAVQS